MARLGLYRQGKKADALVMFEKALDARRAMMMRFMRSTF